MNDRFPIKKYSFIFGLSLLLLSAFSPFSSFAQTTNFQLYSEADIITEIYPEIPGPHEEVKLHLKSYVFNLNNYYIVWFLNGNKVKEGYGERDFSFTTGNSGEVTRVQANIEIDGRIFKKEYRFSPAVVDLLWEAQDAYAPPFYRGKTLPLYQGKVKVVAIPETQIIEPKDSPNLVYYWTRNGKRVIGASGFGKNSYTFETDPLVYNEIVSVRMNDRRENSFAENTVGIHVKDFSPKILFYEINESGRTLVNRALNAFRSVEGDSIHLAFHPLNMSTVKPNFIDLFVNWSINGERKPPQDFGKQNELAITTDGKAGEVNVGLKLESIDHILQSPAEEQLKLLFSGKKS